MTSIYWQEIQNKRNIVPVLLSHWADNVVVQWGMETKNFFAKTFIFDRTSVFRRISIFARASKQCLRELGEKY